MKVVIQRVSAAEVSVEGKTVGKISRGLLLLIGVAEGDQKSDVDWLAAKILNLRIFPDENHKMNLSIQDIGGEILCISQFTLLADYKKGNRPSFISAAKPSLALPLFNYFKDELKKGGAQVQFGIFGENMQVSLTNDGPATIVMDSVTMV